MTIHGTARVLPPLPRLADNPNPETVRRCGFRDRLSSILIATPRGGCHVMKLVYEYLADALKFERLAAEEKDEQLKLSFLQQAAAYRKLAEKRANDIGKPLDQSSQ
jgi:hypothetical protein